MHMQAGCRIFDHGISILTYSERHGTNGSLSVKQQMLDIIDASGALN